MLALLVLWSIFGERIALLSPYEYRFQEDETNKLKPSSLYNAVDQFIKEKLSTPGVITEVNLAFNHGIRWLTFHERTQLLRKIVEQANRVNIVMPKYEIAEEFTLHQRKPGTYYVSSYTRPQHMWQDFAQEYPQKITLNTVPIPILRQYISFHFENKEQSALYIGFYTYGGNGFDKNPFYVLSYGADYYDVYEKEFKYLWDLAIQQSI